MPMGIYKPGQGYWVRVLTAVFVGVLVLAATAWAWGQAGTIRLPTASHAVAVRAATGSIAPGAVVTYLRPADDEAATPTPFGTGVVSQATLGADRSGTLVIASFSNDEVREQAATATRLEADAFSALVQSASLTPVFNPQYLQAAVAGAILVAGSVAIFLFVGARKNSSEFLIATDGEMKKVNWSTYKEIRAHTLVVIVAAFLIAGILFGIDWVFANVFRVIGVLET